MIASLFKVLGDGGRGRLQNNLLGLLLESILTGLAFTLLVPLLRAVLRGDFEAAWLWTGLMLGLFAIYGVVRFITQFAAYRAAISLARDLFARIEEHIAKLPLGWLLNSNIGAVGNLLSQGVIDIMALPAHLLRPIVQAYTTPLTLCLLMFIFDWRLALACLLTIPMIVLSFRWSGNRLQKTDTQTHKAMDHAATQIIEYAQAQQVLRAYSNNAQSAFHALDQAFVEQRHAGRKLTLSGGAGIAVVMASVQLAFVVVAIIGISLALGGQLDAAEFVALLVLVMRFVEPLGLAADLNGALRISLNKLRRMEALLAVKPLAESAHSVPIEDASVEFTSVGFAYDPETPVLSDISFKAEAGQVTAIVGPSGSGKTTLLRLIARFWDVDTGRIEVGGADIRNLQTADLMDRLSIVFQDVYLVDGTIGENITLGRPNATEDEIAEAIRLAQIEDTIARLPLGLNTPTGEAGAQLSGGEAQRVSIARALLLDAPIILLDEMSSAIDPVGQKQLQDAIYELAKDKTVIMIAHQLSTIAAADQILFLEKGRIVESGTHEHLMLLRKSYANVWRDRKKSEGWTMA